MKAPESESALSAHCWKDIGVWGDRTCPELKVHAHCRACPVYVRAGRRIFDRDPPPDYRDEWRARLAQAAPARPGETVSLMVFGIGRETFALRTQHLTEVIRTRTVRRLPHRDTNVLHGLVNVHGLLRPCVSLTALLGVEPGAPDHDAGALVVGRRMLVVRAAGGPLVIPVDAAHGTQRVPLSHLRAPPGTVARDTARFTTRVFPWKERAVAVLDGEAVLAALEAKLQ